MSLEKKHILEKYDNFFSSETKRMFDEFTKSVRYKTNLFFIEGLKRKGFEFEKETDLVEFIKKNCRCEDRHDLKQKTYFVNDVPFLLHKYEMNTNLELSGYDRTVKTHADCGTFTYL